MQPRKPQAKSARASRRTPSAAMPLSPSRTQRPTCAILRLAPCVPTVLDGLIILPR
jgi:hypothetical protein